MKRSSSGLSRGFLIKTLVLVWGIRLGLWLLPFKTMRRIVSKLAQPTGTPVGWPLPQQIAWAVTVTSRRVPKATCLTQALVTQVLLGRYGYPSTLRLGVGLSETGQFQAHAWVESNGTVVIGGKEAELAQKYAAFPAFEGEGS